MNKVRTRFAPSPTGALHIGGLRTALYSYALAKHSKGDFILRIEDTDKKREIKGSGQKIQELLKFFNLNWDEMYTQSSRVSEGIYQKYAQQLIKTNHAYYCQCEARNAKEKGYSKVLRDPCRDKNFDSGAIKLRVPDQEKISFHDFVIGKDIDWDTSDIPDATLLKSDGYPTYHLAVVVDDSGMNITHVLRGHDWLPSTPIHLLVYKYLNKELPYIGHLTDILDPTGGKLSKRKGSVSAESFLQEGYLPDAILNFIMLLGWAPKDNRELFTLEEFVKEFDKGEFQKSNPVLNIKKLDWFSKHYIQKLSATDFAESASKVSAYSQKPDFTNIATKTAPLVASRITTLADYDSLAGFFFEVRKPDLSLLGPDHKRYLESAKETLENIKTWDLETINSSLMSSIQSNNFKTGDFFMDLRIAITGSKQTPPINESIHILGKKDSLKRLSRLLQ